MGLHGLFPFPTVDSEAMGGARSVRNLEQVANTNGSCGIGTVVLKQSQHNRVGLRDSLPFRPYVGTNKMSRRYRSVLVHMGPLFTW